MVNIFYEKPEDYGLYEAIAEELYVCDLTKFSTIFVEKVSKYSYSCYKLSWQEDKPKVQAKQPREIKSEKIYISKDSRLQCFKKAKQVIDWYREL